MVEPHSSNFRVISTIFLGVQIFRKFTVNNNKNKKKVKFHQAFCCIFYHNV